MNIELLREKLGHYILQIESFRNEVTLIIDKESIVPVCRFLKNDKRFAFDFLSDCCGVDRFPETPRFWVVYHIYSTAENHRLRIKAALDERDPTIDSIVTIWGSADWHERECYDMLGITFRKHPDLRRILLSDDFDGFPLRKDFPLEGL
jgi:NADH-quinone oxidoreductase subunit C